MRGRQRWIKGRNGRNIQRGTERETHNGDTGREGQKLYLSCIVVVSSMGSGRLRRRTWLTLGREACLELTEYTHTERDTQRTQQ